MSWLFSQALVVEYSVGICSDGAQSAQLNLTPTQQAYCSPDKMMDVCRLSRFGMTFGPLTDDHGAALLTWYLAGFPAKTSALPEKAQDLKASAAASGQKWRGSLAKYDPATHSLKTAQCSLFEDLTESSAILPRWGSMRNGELFQQPIPALRTSANESGLSLPTPSASHCETRPSKTWNPKSQSGRSLGCMAATGKWPKQMWATPTTMDKLPPKSAEALHREATVARPGRSKPANLRGQVSNMQNWPTPAARDYKGARKPEAMAKTGRNPETNSLPDAVEFQNGETGRLNPQWVEWLMGWPLGWTDLQPLAMDRFHEWRQQHSLY